MHLHPSSCPPRVVAAPVVDALFPPGRRSRIPIFAITGTNGKSTTVRMVERVLSRHGLNVGMTTTSGIHVGGQLLKASDASGPRSARSILRNPTVRSEEHTSELQSLLRTSYAVFCLKKH